MCKSREHRARDQGFEGEGVKALRGGPSWKQGHLQIFQSSDESRLWKAERCRGGPPHSAGFLHLEILPLLGEGSGDTEKLASGSFRAGMMLLEE